MLPALAFHKSRQTLRIFIIRIILIIEFALRTLILKNDPPSRLDHLSTGHLKIDLTRLGQHRRVAHLALGIENRNKMQCHQIIHFLLVCRHSLRPLARRNNGMVVRHLAVVKNLLRLGQFRTDQRCYRRKIVLDPVQRSRYLRIDIVTQISRIHTGIGRQPFLIQRLYQLQRLLCRKTILLIAVDLQRCQIIQLRRILQTLLLLHTRDRQQLILDAIHQRLTLLFTRDRILPVFHRNLGTEQRIPVIGLQLPIGLRHKMLDLRLPFYHQRQRRRLHTTYR